MPGNAEDIDRACRAATAAAADSVDAAACTDEVTCADARRPQQERGQRRFDAILDATAELIAEEGIGSVRMHRICQLTRTTTGSMYHFFPDREALLRALVERHARELQAQMERFERETASEWAGLSADDAVDRFVTPFLTYVDTHPAFLALLRIARADGSAERDGGLGQIILRLTGAIVASRDPAASASDVRSRAIALIAILEGMIELGARLRDPNDVPALRHELRRALVAYLDSFASSSSYRPERRPC